MSGLRIDVADLLAHPGTRRDVRVSARLEDLAGSAARVMVRGTVNTTWHGECSYCLTDLDEPLVLHVDELFEPDPVEGETYPIEGHEIDLEQLARDAVLLELPLAPHCATPCASDPTRVATDDTASDTPGDEPSSAPDLADPRWAVLSELEIQ
jgi:DUF177 domain-containing protein